MAIPMTAAEVKVAIGLDPVSRVKYEVGLAIAGIDANLAILQSAAKELVALDNPDNDNYLDDLVSAIGAIESVIGDVAA